MSDAIDFTLLRVAVFRLPERNQSRRASTWCQNMSHPKFQNDILWDIISGLQPEIKFGMTHVLISGVKKPKHREGFSTKCRMKFAACSQLMEIWTSSKSLPAALLWLV
ncbi:MAG: hypothetical protein H6560_27540 [Lewinellaceae bacterium]|nr:hypothetical protein [Lewinellaceae bacterium]